MSRILSYLRGSPKFYSNLKAIYGQTIGLWSLKTLYLEKIGIYNGNKYVKLLSNSEADKLISNKIKSGKPFMLARYGSTEFRNLTGDNDFELLGTYSGFFPNDKTLLEKFRKIYWESLKSLDILAVWNYKNHFLRKLKLVKKSPGLETLISIDSVGKIDHGWIKELKNKKVLVIHPFKKTIEQQYKVMNKLKILPKLKKLEVIRAVQTIAGNPDNRFKDWFEALNYMKKEIDKKDFDIAFIGCGAYGLPLAAYVKNNGKQAIHLGGSLQLLFGIMGDRWKENKEIKTNKYWAKPLNEDIPKNHKKVEGGCYW